MAERRRVVLGDREASDRLPEWASMGVVIIEWLRARGLWAEAADRLKIQREGGYAGIDALMFLTYYFASGLTLGVKEFSERAREHHMQLAAIGGRRRLPTQASMSRILASVEVDHAQEFGDWLLRETPGIAAVLQHPSVLTRDAVGQGWHVFDWDPTVTTLRHRALPVFDGMPEARRRSECLAQPGYPGRKRGDVQFSRATLQHAGSGLWLGIEMAPGNGAQRHAIHSAIRQVIATCEHAELPRNRVILRADGAAGNVPFITACTAANVHYVTRLAHYQLLEDPGVVRHLNEATWFTVPSSGSGPTRQAADLGQVMLEPAPNTLQADGTAFEPIAARVVVSRFACASDGRGAGVVLDGWQYELYGTDLTASAWPESEIVAGYYGRAGQENRFCQEDRELGLDRIFSYHLPGQQLATLIGLFVWNFYICRGMDIARPPEQLPQQLTHASAPVVQPPRLSTAEERLEAKSTKPTVASAPAVFDSTHNTEATRPSTVVACAESMPSPAPANTTGELTPTGTSQHRMVTTLNQIDWEQVLGKHPGWTWDAAEAALRCPAKELLPLVRIEQVKEQPIRARFQADWRTCTSCALRPTCIKSDDPRYRKDVRLPIPSPHAEPLREMSLRGVRPIVTPQPVAKRGVSSPSRSAQPRPIWRSRPLLWQPIERSPERSPLAVASPTLLPAELRKLSRQAMRNVEVHVAVDLPAPRPRLSPVLASSAAKRQRRRLAWAERLCWNELPDGSSLQLRLLGAPAVQRLLATWMEVTKACQTAA